MTLVKQFQLNYQKNLNQIPEKLIWGLQLHTTLKLKCSRKKSILKYMYILHIFLGLNIKLWASAKSLNLQVFTCVL